MNGKANGNFTQVSFDVDPNGHPVVIFKLKRRSIYGKLTQGIAYIGYSLDNITTIFYSGYWENNNDGIKNDFTFLNIYLP